MANFDRDLALEIRSRVFDQKKPENWFSKLKEVHQYAWETWTSNLSHLPAHAVAAGDRQTPGVISEDVKVALEDEI